ncbi:MAG: hypothetical protein LH469_12550 [Frankiaceae bacterium]|nr:hypothetical protein [Frankiaceae bacterium]
MQIDTAAVARAEAVRRAAAEEQARAQSALEAARAEQAAAQRALAAAETPAERAEATAALDEATAEADQASAEVTEATKAVAEATAQVTAVAETVDDRRLAVGLPPLASSSPSPPVPISGGSNDSATSQAASYVQDVVPGRSTTLLLALVGGIVALLVLIAREWTR